MTAPRTRVPAWRYAVAFGCLAWLLWDNPDFLPPLLAAVLVAVFAGGCGALIGLGVIAFRRLRQSVQKA
jgi:hypothetical protein